MIDRLILVGVSALLPIAAKVTLAAATSGDPLLDWLSRAGALGIMAFVLIALMRGWLVTGRECAEVRKERDRAMEMVYTSAEITQRALETAKGK